MHFSAIRSKTLSLLSLGVVLFVFALFLGNEVDRPWVDQIDFNGAVWSQAAHNILRAGLLETQGASTAFYFGPLPIPSTGYYLHHPPLLHLGVAAMYSLFGEHEWAARIVPIGCSLASAVLLWLLVSSCLGPRIAAFCTAVFASLPMMLLYGTMVNFEPVVLFFILSTLLALRYWEQTGRTVWKAAFFLSLFLGLWVDWAMHLFALVLFAWWTTRQGRDSRRLAWIVLGMTALCALCFVIHSLVLQPGILQDLKQTLFVRIASNDQYHYTQWQWVCKVTGSIVRHYLWGGLLAAAIGVAVTFWRRKEAGFKWLGWASAMVFGMDAVFVGVFQNDSYIHEYIAFYFVVPVSIMAGIALNELAVCIENAAPHRLRIAGVFSGVVLAFAATLSGQAQADALKGRFCILELEKKESGKLIPSLGETIRKRFSPQTRVLCNFMPYYGPHLEYYAKRQVTQNLDGAEDWKPVLQNAEGEIGGVVWMGDEDAKEILASLPPGKKEFVNLESENFCVWTPAAKRVRR
ncbi:MAG: glycosyltransferase family 39 protein [Verrucomicrobiota bacterium]